jgi:hypothetical protein
MFHKEYKIVIIILKNSQTNLFFLKFKNWVINQFVLFNIGTVQELNLYKADTYSI